jgi:hypothetical protein
MIVCLINQTERTEFFKPGRLDSVSEYLSKNRINFDNTLVTKNGIELVKAFKYGELNEDRINMIPSHILMNRSVEELYSTRFKPLLILKYFSNWKYIRDDKWVYNCPLSGKELARYKSYYMHNYMVLSYKYSRLNLPILEEPANIACFILMCKELNLDLYWRHE